jgi:hypothetical protein
MLQLPENLLEHLELLPDGSATNDIQVWITGWADFLHKQITTGKMNVNEIEGFDPETGALSLKGIRKLYERNRQLH